MPEIAKILVTGGSGYVGGRLISLLEQRGDVLRCMARRPETLQARVTKSTEVVHGDVLQPDSMTDALNGIETAYYMVHSMGTGRDFEADDRAGARNFARAAHAAGVKRIIYLGGLGDSEQKLSAHLRSRQEVGQVLSESGAQVIEFRASIVIGSGSLREARKASISFLDAGGNRPRLSCVNGSSRFSSRVCCQLATN